MDSVNSLADFAACRHHRAPPRMTRPGADPLAVEPAVQHRPARQTIRRMSTVAEAMICAASVVERRSARRRRSGSREDLDQPEVLQVAVEDRRRAAAGLLDRMDRELEGDPPASRIPSRTVPRARGGAGCRREVEAGLRDPDDRAGRIRVVQRQAGIPSCAPDRSAVMSAFAGLSNGRAGASFSDLSLGRPFGHSQRDHTIKRWRREVFGEALERTRSGAWRRTRAHAAWETERRFAGAVLAPRMDHRRMGQGSRSPRRLRSRLRVVAREDPARDGTASLAIVEVQDGVTEERLTC